MSKNDKTVTYRTPLGIVQEKKPTVVWYMPHMKLPLQGFFIALAGAVLALLVPLSFSKWLHITGVIICFIGIITGFIGVLSGMARVIFLHESKDKDSND